MKPRAAFANHRAHAIARWAIVLASISRAALAAAPDEDAKTRARELMAKGRKARADADLAGAAQSFRAADDIMHVPTTGLELAKALRDLGRLVAASEALTRVEALPEDGAEPDAFINARRAAKELKLELDARIPTLRITASPSDPETRLTLDGKPIEAARAASGLRVDAGRHVATAERDGAVQERVVQLAESGSAELSFEFDAPPDAAPSAPRVPPKTPTSTYVIYGLTGLAVAGIGTGVGLAVWSNSRKGALERDCAPHCPDQDVTDLRVGYVAANVTTALGVASGLAALTIHFVREGKRGPKRETSASLTLTSGAGPGVTLAGSF